MMDGIHVVLGDSGNQFVIMDVVPTFFSGLGNFYHDDVKVVCK